jgi:gluconolactonase
MGPDGKCYVCNNGGFSWTDDEHALRPSGQAPNYAGGWIERVDIGTGQVERLYDASDKAKLKGPNDLVFDNHGGFYFTDPGKSRGRDRDVGAVCYARADGSSCRELIFPMTTPNGIGLSPDGSRLYVAETETARLWAFELAGPGQIIRRPFPSPHGGWLIGAAADHRRFDSLAVDAAGNICVASVATGGIVVFAPEGGIIDVVPLADPFVTNLCFGGPGLRTAFVTLSGRGKLVAIDWPRGGLPLAY